LRNPDWHVVYDVDPEQAQATRHNVEKDGTKYRLIPSAWNPQI
jgi:hypothetical protein